MNSNFDGFEQTDYIPTTIGRYRVKQVLGQGGFGSVYLATDEELGREVAVKVPNENLLRSEFTAKDYLDEARMVAKLDHPNIVPVFDVGSCDEYVCFVVSKFIDGPDLRNLLKQHQFDYFEAAKLIAKVAEALHHAHKHGLVHRDIKPSNILLDGDFMPYVADFGLALPEHNVGKGPKFAGTPAYMSPEQARGEGHRVDGRSDVFSLGAVLFEMLSGKRAFRGDTRAELREQIESYDPRPLRQFNEHIPKELDRICQKALSKRANERYWTAHDMAEDLNAFLEQSRSEGHADQTWSRPLNRFELETRIDDSGQTPHPTKDKTEPLSESQAPVILPKGLRSFDEDDADFFLELLPGPRDREGLPDILRFWKKRIEASDVDNSFRVGLIYGPSGCGKSSFVKAGLLPRLSKRIVPVFIESTTEFTESRLLARLQKVCPMLDRELDLSDSISAIRRGEGTPDGTKVLLIFDQFEQWLHSVRGDSADELVAALRQCDGVRVQAILMVRSDFWMAVTRFLNELEVDLVQGKNFAAIDLFPQRHARKVLIAFGRAFGAIAPQGQLEPDQTEFVNQSVEGLAQGGKLICVRLALYAEMMKNKPWSSATLKQVGGTEGVGSAFLEDSFGPQANPKIRLHQIGARLVLRSLLPESETMINVKMQSYEELYRASGYSDTKKFNQLIRILDSEMRLISPTDPSGIMEESDLTESTDTVIDPDKKYFRLTHDYLVTALRKWLNRKQRETRKGRAELLLEERASFWHAKQETRYLPSVMEHVQIRSFTSPSQWTNTEKEVMGSAAKTHGRWAAIAMMVLVLLTAGGFGLRNSVLAEQQRIKNDKIEEQHGAEAARLVEGLLKSDTNRASEFVSELTKYRSWAEDDLRFEFANSKPGSLEKLHSAMSLASDTSECQDYIRDQLPLVSAQRFQPVVKSLMNANKKLPALYPELLADEHADPHQRLVAACAIAQFDDAHETWENVEQCRFVSEQMTKLYPSQLSPLRDALAPVAASLTPHLQTIFMDHERNYQQRFFALESLVEFEKDSPLALFRLLVDCDQRQFPLVLEALAGENEQVIDLAKQELKRQFPADADESEKELSASRRANAAVALYQLNQFEEILPLFADADDPRLRSFVIHWLANRNSNPAILLEKLQGDSDVATQRALISAIGEFPANQFSAVETALLNKRLEFLLGSNTAGLASAAHWLLAINDSKADQRVIAAQKEASQKQRLAWTKKLDELRSELDAEKNPAQWESQSGEIAKRQAAELANSKFDRYYTSHGQQMIRVDAKSFLMGDPDDIGPGKYSNPHQRHINRMYSLAATEVTVAQWSEFLKDSTVSDATRQKFANNAQPGPNRPIINTNWFEAVHYCNWLSKQEGIPESQWCFVPRLKHGFVVGMKVRPEFWKLHGYRLPTQAEWEYACRAGSQTQRHYGLSESLLGKYAWYQGNSEDRTRPVGTRKPNQWGFFDMHGNAMEWCFDLHYPFKKFQPVEFDFPYHKNSINKEERSIRGGAYYDQIKDVRSAHRYSYDPSSQLFSFGLRVARTLRTTEPNGDKESGSK